MEELKITIQSLDDVGQPIEGVDHKPEDAKIERAVIMQRGTVMGKTTVMLLLRTKDGKLVSGQLTANLVEGLAGAVRGAVQRFGG